MGKLGKLAHLGLEVDGHGGDVAVEAWHGRRNGPGQVEELLCVDRHIEREAKGRRGGEGRGVRVSPV